jgi:hypothetical protein
MLSNWSLNSRRLLKLEGYSYLIGLTALVQEQKEFSKVLQKLNSSVKDWMLRACTILKSVN